MRILKTLHKKLLAADSVQVFGAESCTGGLVSSLLTRYSGSSTYFLGSLVSYSNEIKESGLGVSTDLLVANGAVSQEVVEAMLDGCKKWAPRAAHFAISGIAGPGGGTADKPVGLVYLGVSLGQVRHVEKHYFKGNRDTVRKKAAKRVLFLLVQCIDGKIA